MKTMLWLAVALLVTAPAATADEPDDDDRDDYPRCETVQVVHDSPPVALHPECVWPPPL